MKTQMVTIPSASDEMQETLTTLGGLVNASEWTRAAIVYAFTYAGTNQNDACTDPNKRTISAFCRLGIVGLRHRPTVIAYRKRWADLVAQGLAPDVQPGDTFQLPDAPWKPEVVNREALDNCLGHINHSQPDIYAIRQAMGDIDHDDQRKELVAAIQRHADEWATLAMECGTA